MPLQPYRCVKERGVLWQDELPGELRGSITQLLTFRSVSYQSPHTVATKKREQEELTELAVLLFDCSKFSPRRDSSPACPVLLVHPFQAYHSPGVYPGFLDGSLEASTSLRVIRD